MANRFNSVYQLGRVIPESQESRKIAIITVNKTGIIELVFIDSVS